MEKDKRNIEHESRQIMKVRVVKSLKEYKRIKKHKFNYNQEENEN